MPKLSYPYLLSGALLALTGCKKPPPESCPGACTVVTGRMLTANGTSPIRGLPLTVKWINRVSLFGGEVRTKAVGTTNADGRYELRFFIKDDELLEGYFQVGYSPDKSRYYVLDDGFALNDPTRDTTITQDYLIPRKAFLKLSMTNPDAVATQGSYWTNFNSRYGRFPNPATCIQGGGPAVSWPLRILSDVMEVAGDQPLVVEHLKFKGGVRTVAYDTLVVPAGTTRDYTVTF